MFNEYFFYRKTTEAEKNEKNKDESLSKDIKVKNEVDIKVSKEKYFKVESSSLADAFKKENETSSTFSLLAAFGRDPNDEETTTKSENSQETNLCNEFNISNIF